MKPNRNWILSLAISLMVLALLGCRANENVEQDATARALGQSIGQTATAAAAVEINREANRQTAEAEATALREAALATQAAAEALSEEERAATATAAAPILAELPQYGVDASKGEVGWIHPPLELYAEGYMQYDYGNVFLGTVAEDFVVSADITWNTRFGTAACGFVLRSDGNEEAFNQYLVLATRGGNGRVIFNTMAQGEVLDGYDLYAYRLDPEFDWRNDTTNRLTVVGRGSNFTVFTNGTEIGQIDAGEPPPAPYIPAAPEKPPEDAEPEVQEAYAEAKREYDKVVAEIWANYNARLSVYEDHGTEFPRGFIAMVALNESGYTDCKFNNAWLWLISSE